ncbi:hypothetical protein [Janibacter sp. G56]|uniref:hypothetical protein n=1 Tax=Janibacter sp. G56 TaxID=3418717 RepID=UPI003D0956B0
MDTRLRALLTAQAQVCTTEMLRSIDIDAPEVAALLRQRTVKRLRRGLFVEAATWKEATPEQRLTLRTRATLLDRPGSVASHGSAAAVHGLPLWGVPTDVVDVLGAGGRTRTRGGVRLHPRPERLEPEVVAGLAVVPVATAIVQVVVEHGVVPGVVCLDRALHERRVTREQLESAAAVLQIGPRARSRMARVVKAADPACESVGETRTRVLLSDLGVAVRSQVVVRDDKGLIGRVDFLVGDRVVVEFDGILKYGGADGRMALRAEKVREDRLRAAGYVVVRLVWSDLDDPVRVLGLIQRALRLAA